MEQCLKNKILFFVLLTGVVFTIVFAEVINSHDYNHTHDCAGDHANEHIRAECPVCLKVEITGRLLRTLKLVSISVCPAVQFIRNSDIFSKYLEYNFCLSSPVVLKVRFNS